MQIGNANFPLVLLIPVVILMGIIFMINLAYYQRYTHLMRYLAIHHHHLYQRLRIKPTWGPFYSTGVNRIKPLLDFAQNHPSLNDAKAEKLLVDFIHFDRRMTWIGTILVVMSALIFLGMGVVLTS